MHWIEAKVTFESSDESLAVELIADIFDDLGTKGVLVDDPHLDPEEGWGDDAVAQPAQPAVTGYLPANQHLEQQRQRLENALGMLASQLDLTYTITYQSIDEEDWAESWKAYFWPQKITSRLVVKPSWRNYQPKPDEQVIEIDPGMAFGTGTHPTTNMCMQLLERHIQPNQSILDVGTGSGILLITAAKLGATPLTGVDLDTSALEIAAKNLELNGINPEHYTLLSGNLLDQVTQKVDLVVANILAEVVLDLLYDIDQVLEPGGILICSGIIEPFQSVVTQKMIDCGFDILQALKQEDWVALSGRRIIT